MNIIRCMSENLGDEAMIEECRDCFKVDFNFETEAGVDGAKACAEKFWTGGWADCQTEIGAMIPGNSESMEAVVKCFDARLEKQNQERCLKESESSDLQGKLTEGSVCIIDSWKYAFSYVKNSTMKRPRPAMGQNMRGRAMKMMIMRMKTLAHCEDANDGDSTKTNTCVQCFADAIPSRRPRARGGREADPAVIQAIATCSDTQLSPKYDECTALMKADTDKKTVHECYEKILAGSYVSDCITENSITTADPESLGKVVKCAVEDAFEWLAEKNPEAAEKFEKFLMKAFGDDEDSSEEE